jgi:hypothetical protein
MVVLPVRPERKAMIGFLEAFADWGWAWMCVGLLGFVVIVIGFGRDD